MEMQGIRCNNGNMRAAHSLRRDPDGRIQVMVSADDRIAPVGPLCLKTSEPRYTTQRLFWRSEPQGDADENTHRPVSYRLYD
jgi:hypothetical protein